MGGPSERAVLDALTLRLEELLGGLAALAGAGRALSAPGAVLLGLAGAALLLAGGRSRRAFGLVGGAALGALAALAAEAWLAARLPGTSRLALAAAGASGGASLGLAFPWLAVAGAGALPGAVLGAGIPVAGSRPLGLAIGAAALGALAVMATEATVAGLSAGLGAAALGAALLAAPAARGVADEVAARPALFLGWCLVVGLAGAALQHGRTWAQGGGRRAPSPPSGEAGEDVTRPG